MCKLSILFFGFVLYSVVVKGSKSFSFLSKKLSKMPLTEIGTRDRPQIVVVALRLNSVGKLHLTRDLYFLIFNFSLSRKPQFTVACRYVKSFGKPSSVRSAVDK